MISKNNINLERYSRQVILKKFGIIGQKKLQKSNVMIVGAGGLGSPAAIYLAGLGVGKIGIVDSDNVQISNIHRQILFNEKDIKKNKAKVAKNKLTNINSVIKINSYPQRLNDKNISKILKNYELVLDSSDNFKTKFLLNDYCKKNDKILITGAVSKFTGHIFTFNFNKKNSPCLRCFMPKTPNMDTSCEAEGIIATVCGIVGVSMANEAIKEILNIGLSLCGYILMINTLSMEFKKIKLNKNFKCNSKCILIK